jgi:hypothetical protein
VAHDPLAVDPIILGEGAEMAHHLVIFGHRDPTIYLVRERMVLEPTVYEIVEAGVSDLGKVRVGEDS